MSNKSGNSKRQRAHKISKGEQGATKHPLSELEKALLDKGLAQRVTPINGKPWRGVAFVGEPYDAKQAAENRRLYPHLFEGD